MEKTIEGIRINVQRSTKIQKARFEPEEAVVSITIPATKVSKKLLDAMMTIADQTLLAETTKWGRPLAMDKMEPEKLKEVEDYVNSMLDGE